MAIENGTSLVLFANGTQANYTELSNKLDNTFYVTSDTNNLYLGSALIGSNVKDASYDGGILTIELVDSDTDDIVLNFSDIASASAVGAAIVEAIANAKADVIGENGDEWGSTTNTDDVNGSRKYTLFGLKKEIDGIEDTDTVFSTVTSTTLVTGTVDKGTTLALSDNGLSTALADKLEQDDIVEGVGISLSKSTTDNTITIKLAPANGEETIGGVKAGTNISIDEDGTISTSNVVTSVNKNNSDDNGEVTLDGTDILVGGGDSDYYVNNTIASSIEDIDDRLSDVETWQDEYSAPTIPVYTIGTTITTDGYASTYQLFKDGDAVSGSIINIPKDQFLSDATIVTGTVTDGVYSSEGTNTYIKLEFQVTGDGIDPGTIYLDVQDFFDVYTEGTGIDITDNKISNTGVLSIEGITGIVDLVEGDNVSISADTTAKTITISTTDTDTVTTINGRSGTITIGKSSTSEDYLTVTDTNGAITIGAAGIDTAISGAVSGLVKEVSVDTTCSTYISVTPTTDTGDDNKITSTISLDIQSGETSVTDDKIAAKSYVDEVVDAAQTAATLTWSIIPEASEA